VLSTKIACAKAGKADAIIKASAAKPHTSQRVRICSNPV
jgi:hypothetical protein